MKAPVIPRLESSVKYFRSGNPLSLGLDSSAGAITTIDRRSLPATLSSSMSGFRQELDSEEVRAFPGADY